MSDRKWKKMAAKNEEAPGITLTIRRLFISGTHGFAYVSLFVHVFIFQLDMDILIRMTALALKAIPRKWVTGSCVLKLGLCL